MAEEKFKEEDQELPLRKLDISLAPADSHAERCQDERPKHSVTLSSAKHLVCTAPGSSNFPIPGTKPPGIFIDSHIPGLSLTTIIKGIPTDDESYIAQFHDSESEDIFDLYNACNGVVRDDGFLDITKLDELSKEELEILNVQRLQEIWRHTISGCATCTGIVRTLNSVRGMLGDEELEPLGETHSGNGKSH